MRFRFFFSLALLALPLAAIQTAAAPATAAGEYAKHFEPLAKLSTAVAEAMPAEHYSFRPHPDSMTFGELMSHIATTNYQFCAGLHDRNPPELPKPAEREAVIRFLSDSFSYCSGVISGLSEQQLAGVHDSPDGRLAGREVLLAMFVHVAHHRGQAEIYLRDKGIKPPAYRV